MDIYNIARKLSQLLCDEVRQVAITRMQASLSEGEVLDEIKLLVLRVDCHHHLSNI